MQPFVWKIQPSGESNYEKGISSKMLDVVIGTIIGLIAAIVTVFLILIAINIALFFKLRSVNPRSPRARPPVAPHRPASRENATR